MSAVVGCLGADGVSRWPALHTLVVDEDGDPVVPRPLLHQARQVVVQAHVGR